MKDEVFRLEKDEIDKAVGDKTHKVFPADFAIEAFFERVEIYEGDDNNKVELVDSGMKESKQEEIDDYDSKNSSELSNSVKVEIEVEEEDEEEDDESVEEEKNQEKKVNEDDSSPKASENKKEEEEEEEDEEEEDEEDDDYDEDDDDSNSCKKSEAPPTELKKDSETNIDEKVKPKPSPAEKKLVKKSSSILGLSIPGWKRKDKSK